MVKTPPFPEPIRKRHRFSGLTSAMQQDRSASAETRPMISPHRTRALARFRGRFGVMAMLTGALVCSACEPSRPSAAHPPAAGAADEHRGSQGSQPDRNVQAVKTALEGLLKADEPSYVLLEDSKSGKIVQFAGSADEPLCLELPSARLRPEERTRAKRFFSRLDIERNRIVEGHINYQVILDDDVDQGTALALSLMQEVFRLPPHVDLEVRGGYGDPPADVNEIGPRPLLEYLWTYRWIDGVDPPRPGIVFCVVANPEFFFGARRLVVGGESLVTPEDLGLLNQGKIDQTHSKLLYRGAAPSREIVFQRMDLDDDGRDEVLLTGRGGAEGTSLLTIFRVNRHAVQVIFEDSSPLGFEIFDRHGDGQYEIANAGFETADGSEEALREKQYRIHHLQGGKYVLSEELSEELLSDIIDPLTERSGAPLADREHSEILRIYE